METTLGGRAEARAPGHGESSLLLASMAAFATCLAECDEGSAFQLRLLTFGAPGIKRQKQQAGEKF
jgi:hypothetical protein